MGPIDKNSTVQRFYANKIWSPGMFQVVRSLEDHSEPTQTSKIAFLSNIVNDQKLLAPWVLSIPLVNMNHT